MMGRGASARPVSGSLATGSFRDLVGVRPEVGRFRGPADDHAGADHVVVIDARSGRVSLAETRLFRVGRSTSAGARTQ